MNVTKLAKALIVLSLSLGSVALALHQDNTDRRDELEAINERLEHLETVKLRGQRRPQGETTPQAN